MRLLWLLTRPVFLVFERLSREGRMLATTICGVAAFGVDVGRTEAHVLIMAAGSLLLASLLFSWAYPPRGLTVAARAPRRVAVGEELTVAVHLRNEGPRGLGALRVDRPRLPRDGAWTDDALSIPELPPGERAVIELKARFSLRGERRMGPVSVAALVPLGLAQGAPRRSEPLRFVVVPRCARVARLTTPTNRRHQPGGVARASRVGDTSELLGVRPYRPGDPVRDLHARSWARLGFPVVREYQQEYFTRIGVVLDTDRAAGSARIEAALSLAAGVVAHLCGGEALVDLLAVGEHVHALALGRSLGALDQALDVLAGVRPGPAFSSARVLASVGPHLDRLSSVILIALSWDEPRESFAAAVRNRGVGCAVLVVGSSAASVPGARVVPLDAISRNEALSL